MTPLSEQLRGVMVDRIRSASPAEILAITSKLCAEEPVPGVSTAKVSPLGLRAIDEHMVEDSRTGLIWSRAVLSGGKRKWADAVRAASEAKLGGLSNWRAPTIQERLSIVDYTRSSPALDPIFQSEQSGYEWTSTPYAPSPGDYAWVVFFGSGVSGWGGQDGEYSVRLVRASQSFNGCVGW